MIRIMGVTVLAVVGAWKGWPLEAMVIRLGVWLIALTALKAGLRWALFRP